MNRRKTNTSSSGIRPVYKMDSQPIPSYFDSTPIISLCNMERVAKLLLLFGLASLLEGSQGNLKAAITCQGEASCKPNQYINVRTAYYGRRDQTTCGGATSSNCHVVNSTDLLTGVCQGQRSCVLDPNQFNFVDPCPGTNKYMKLDYECTDTPVRKVHACEFGTSATARCSNGAVIKVHRGFYGRTDPYKCVENPHTGCLSAATTFEKLRQLCEFQSSCEVAASNDFLGDPCPNVPKYMEMDYYCAPPVEIHGRHTDTVCENSEKTISCLNAQKILITDGFYGRDDTITCGYSANTNCKADGSFERLKLNCNLKNSCTLEAKNEIFGDPCPYVTKFVKISYLCI